MTVAPTYDDLQQRVKNLEKKLEESKTKERQGTEESIRKREWEQTVNAMSDWVCLVDPDRLILRLSWT